MSSNYVERLIAQTVFPSGVLVLQRVYNVEDGNVHYEVLGYNWEGEEDLREAFKSQLKAQDFYCKQRDDFRPRYRVTNWNAFSASLGM